MDIVFQSRMATGYEDWLATPAGDSYRQLSSALLLKVLDFRRGWRVLDVGCGAGVHLSGLMEHGLAVTGIESSPVMAKIASRRLGAKAEVSVGDACDLPFEDNSFDAVIMVNTLELLDRKAQALAEAARVAASRVCLLTMNPLSFSAWFWRMPPGRMPIARGRHLGVMALRRLIGDVLGPVPRRWAGAPLLPRMGVWPLPVGSLLAVSAAVTPRYLTSPLTISAPAPAKRHQPVPSHGRVSTLHRVK